MIYLDTRTTKVILPFWSSTISKPSLCRDFFNLYIPRFTTFPEEADGVWEEFRLAGAESAPVFKGKAEIFCSIVYI